MNRPRYTVRNYRAADFDDYLRLVIEAEKAEPAGRCTEAKLLTEHLKRPNYSPEKDLLLARAKGESIGFIDLTAELKIGRVILDLFICPAYRQKEPAEELLRKAISRAEELGARVAQTCLAETNSTSRELFSEAGFKPVRRFNLLMLRLDSIPEPETTGGFLVRHLEPDEESKLLEIQNLAFAGQWGYNPNTLEEISYFTHTSSFSPEGIFLALEGSKPVGYCWTKIDPSAERKQGQGQIFMLGVDPDYRGKHLGKALLLVGLNYLKSQGLNLAELTVDSENKAASSLYRSVGFKPYRSYLWYEKTITQKP